MHAFYAYPLTSQEKVADTGLFAVACRVWSAFYTGHLGREVLMNELIPDKQTYQTNKRRMAWSALGMMIMNHIDHRSVDRPRQNGEADAVLMMMYGSLSA